MVQALNSRGIPVSYVLYPDEGHGFIKEANRLDFYEKCEIFLALHLRGSVQDAR